MTAPERTKGRGLDASMRGVLVLAVVVVVGLVLLAKAAPSSSSSTAKPDRTTTTLAPRPTTTLGPTTTTKPPAAHPPAQVKVLVLNATGGAVRGASASNGAKVKAQGYDALPPANAVSRPVSAVYFAAGYETDATNVAKALGLAVKVVAPVPSPAPAPNATSANVIVVLGADTPPGP